MSTAAYSTNARRHVHRPPARRPLRVMRVMTRLAVGGPAYHVIYLTQCLRGPDYRCSLIVGSPDPEEGSLEDLAAARGVTFTRIPSLGREISLKTDGPTLWRLYQEMKHWRPDIVHTHNAKAGALGRLAARMAGVPGVVHTYHGHVFHGYFSPRKTELYIRIEQALARWTDRIIVLAESQEKEILGFGIGQPWQMVRIPLGLELAPFLCAEEHRGEVRQQLGIGRETSLVGIVARLVPVKAHDLFLRTASMVAVSRPEVQFLVVGDGCLRQSLEEQALALGFEVVSYRFGQPPVRRTGCSTGTGPHPVVHFLGYRHDLPAVYSDLDVVVLTSRNEGLPVTIIEALAAARPVVATDVGAVRDLILPGETGYLASSGDTVGLSEAIVRQLVDDPAAQAMACRGRERVYPHLSVERLERDIRSLYSELAECKGLPRRSAPIHRDPQGERMMDRAA